MVKLDARPGQPRQQCESCFQADGEPMQQVASDIERYGLLVVFLNVLLAEGGLPLPAFPILITAAPLVTRSHHQVHQIILAGVSGSRLQTLPGIGLVNTMAGACWDCFAKCPFL